MKKTAIVILAAVLVLCIGATSAFAAGGWGGFGLHHSSSALTCPSADGTCPYGCQNCPNENCPAGHYTDQDGDGVCDYAGAGQGQAASALTCPNADGTCPYGGQNCPNENCPAGHYTDQDGDGVCDYAGAGQGQHHGHGAGHCGEHWD